MCVSFSLIRPFILLTIFHVTVSQSYYTSLNSSTCSPAWPLPSNNQSCQPLSPSLKYCRSRGIKLDSHVFASHKLQAEGDLDMIRYSKAVNLAHRFGTNIPDECTRAVDMVYCHYYFPPCDTTGKDVAKLEICRETCEYMWHECKAELEVALVLNQKIFEENYPYHWNIIKCTDFHVRNAGQSPECWYWTGDSNRKIPEDGLDCLDGDGSNYYGKISVTSSGIPCQAWTAQCPHRHTMNSTYPELSSADNYCRNPRGSGYRPWCFTSDKNKRWDYCSIPKCSPDNGRCKSKKKNSDSCNTT